MCACMHVTKLKKRVNIMHSVPGYRWCLTASSIQLQGRARATHRQYIYIKHILAMFAEICEAKNHKCMYIRFCVTFLGVHC